MHAKQKTIAKNIFFCGNGLYTKKKSTITLIPAPENTGFVFIRNDLYNRPHIKANLLFLKQSKDKGIFLEKNGIVIYSIEHIISAINGMDLDNIFIELNNLEVPMLDGSCNQFVEAIEKVGIIEQNYEKKIFYVKDCITINKNTKDKIICVPYKNFRIQLIIDLGYNYFTQSAIFKGDNFKKISSAKIFCNILDKKKNNYYPNEIAYHLLLDIIGLFSLMEIKIKGDFFIYNVNNSTIIEFMDLLKTKIQSSKKIYINNHLYKTSILDIKNIMNILPHRYPFLFIDKIVEISKDYIVGIKNVTINEAFFVGHFQNEPIMPGVLQIEAIAQVGGIFVLNQVNNPELYSTYLLKIDKVRFKKKIIPGDIIVIQVFLLTKIIRGIIYMKGNGYVNQELSIEAELVAKIEKNKNK